MFYKKFVFIYLLLIVVSVCFSDVNNVVVKLTAEEKQYLKDFGVVSMCIDPDWVPYEYLDEFGGYYGISADIISLIGERIGVEFEVIPTVSWEESLKKAKNGECDILPFLNSTLEREKWLTFTEPVFVDSNIIVTNSQHPFVANLSDIFQETVVLPEGTSVEEKLRKDFPELKIIIVKSEIEAFEMVDQGKADMTIRPLITASYTIRKAGMINLRISGRIPEYNNYFRIGIVNGDKKLRDILNKAIRSISAKDRESIINTHVYVKIVQLGDYTWLFRIIFFLVVIIGIALFYSYKLKVLNMIQSETAEKLIDRIDFQNLVNNISCDFVRVDSINLESKISDMLSELCSFYNGENYFFVEICEDSNYEPLCINSDEKMKFDKKAIINLKKGIRNIKAGEKLFSDFLFFKDINSISNDDLRKIVKNDIGDIRSLVIFAIKDRFGNVSAYLGFVNSVNIAGLEKADINDFKVFLNIISDALHKVRSERSLVREKERAEKASLVKSQFLANMSHEIRTPMNGLTGFLQLLERTELDENQKKFVRHINTSANTLLTIINDILDISKIEAGRMVLEKTGFNIVETIKNIKVQHEFEAQKKDLDIVFDIDSDIPEIVIGDSVRFSQILNNLINNSLKFTDSGNISVKAKKESSREKTVGIRFIVRDTGIGMNKETVERLFTPFTQADQSTTRKYGGTGLGLSIVKSIINMMDGYIKVESNPGKGTEFEFTVFFDEFENIGKKDINLHNGSEDNKKDDIKLNPDLGILLVDDNEINLSLINKMLVQKGIHADTASNGEEAFKKAKEKNYDFIFMDCQMPVLDGYKATEKIRKFESQNKVKKPAKIIAMTAYAMKEEIDRCIECGMDSHITKPFKFEEFYKILV